MIMDKLFDHLTAYAASIGIESDYSVDTFVIKNLICSKDTWLFVMYHKDSDIINYANKNAGRFEKISVNHPNCTQILEKCIDSYLPQFMKKGTQT